MAVAPGTRFGPYEVLALIGAGGMGEVYKGRDTRLDRIVAIKVSKEEFSERFEREARNVAALNHPNVCTLHDVGPNYLVMEFVEGDTLSGPIPVETAINYGRQIAEAIEAAHEKGIVHRDLKPANIKVTPEGSIKVLDFGLAKALDADLPASPAQDSPTLSMAMTRAGMILGTAAYMAPEQAKGRPADRRADIWAFGAVLYEMLVGKQVFTGETAAETLASVLKEPISLDRLPKNTPPAVRILLERCMERDLRRRLQAIGEARIVLEHPERGIEAAGPGSARAEIPSTRRQWIPWTLCAVLLAALAAALAWIFRPLPSPHITRFPVIVGQDQVFTNTGRLSLAISPDGSQMVYVANQRLFLRSLADLEARPIPGSELAGFATNPVFSPDGKSLAFWAAFDGTIKRIAVTGGATVTICKVPSLVGLSWNEAGIIFGEDAKRLLRVSPNGGEPEPLVAAKEGELLADPQMLPGGEAILFTKVPSNGGTAVVEKAQIVVQTLKSGERKVLVEGGLDGRYLPTGHLVYMLNGVLFAVPFDVRRLETRGSPVGIVEGVERGNILAAQFAFSDAGSLVYIPGPVSAGTGQNVLGLVDRNGAVEPLKMPPAAYGFPRVSRDGKRVAYQIDDSKDVSVWIYDLSGGTAPRRLTLPGSGGNRYPIWSSDSQWVAFQSDREGDLGIWWQRADGSGAAERLTKTDKGLAHVPDSWSPDGQSFSFTEEKNNSAAIWTYSLRDKKASLFVETPGATLNRSVFSPDGRWVAYQLSAQPNSRIYVRPFPPTATVYVAPVDGDMHHPLWSPDGKEVFYVAGPSLFGHVSISTQPSVSFGTPVRAPRSGFITAVPAGVRTFDFLPDGKRFIGVVQPGLGEQGIARAPQIQVVLNWFEDVKQRAPVR